MEGGRNEAHHSFCLSACRCVQPGPLKKRNLKTTPSEIAQILRQSKSNLAMTLFCLPKQRRMDMQLFYAFCRVVDDAADDPDIPLAERERLLDRWTAVVGAHQPAEQPLERAVVEMMAREKIPSPLMQEIIAGVRMDLHPLRLATQEDLRRYCYRVASCVGLVSVRLFGCTQPESHFYAEELGYALQLTNIMRDVGQDYANGKRIYLPLEALEAAGVTEQQFASQQRDAGFLRLMQQQATVAREHYAQALAHRTPQDLPKLLAAETMRRVYGRVLQKMQADGYQVFSKRYRLGKLGKLALLSRAWAEGWWHKVRRA
jgi:phytoene synthase